MLDLNDIFNQPWKGIFLPAAYELEVPYSAGMAQTDPTKVPFCERSNCLVAIANGGFSTTKDSGDLAVRLRNLGDVQ